VKLLAQKMPRCLNLDVDALCDQWRLYQLENIADSAVKDADGNTKQIDHYWRYVFAIVRSDGNTLKYPDLTVFVKSLLVVTHGNSDVERGFSDSGHSFSDSRESFSE